MADPVFDIRRSNKSYIESPEQYVVVLTGTVYLRIVGQEGSYTVMTATADEDSGDFRAFGDQRAMNEAAVRASTQLGLNPSRRADFHSRPFVEICECEFLSDAYRAAALFFAELMTRPGTEA